MLLKRSKHGAMMLGLMLVLALLAGNRSVSSTEEASYLPLRLAWITFDPLKESPRTLMPASLQLVEAQVEALGPYIVQFKGPIREMDREALASLGVEILGYVPEFAFIVRMDTTHVAGVRSLNAVRWVGPFEAGYRVQPGLINEYLQVENDEKLGLIVLVFPGEDLTVLTRHLEKIGAVVLGRTETGWKGKIRLNVDASLVPVIVALPGISWIESAPEWKLTNNVAAGIMNVRPVWDDQGLYGEGQIVAVCDSGLDRGSTAPSLLHDDFEDGDGNSRVIALYDLVGGGDGAEDQNSGHGTHVAGSVLGNGVRSGSFPLTHTFPATSYVGIAPEAQLVMQAIEDDAGYLSGIPLDLNSLFSQAYADGARIHTNSWSSSVPYGSYTSFAQDVDEFMWDNPDLLVLFSASNDGIDANSDGLIDLYSSAPPGTSKNALTVGATENYRPTGSTPAPGYDIPWGTGSWAVEYPADPIYSDHVSDQPEGLAAFSSRGSLLDGRTKPDIVAPGTNIASVRSQVAASTGWGAIDDDYMFMGGTSMSTPLVAGAAALARSFFIDRHELPSAALLKATLANGATDIYPGQYGSGSTQEIAHARPSVQAGWGRLNLAASLFPTGERRTWYWDSSATVTSSLNFLSTGETASYSFLVTESLPLSVTLAWTDFPGTAAAAGGLVNDLDLAIEGPEGSYTPNFASQRGGTQYMAFGGVNGFIQKGEHAVRFTPISYPVLIDKGIFYLAGSSYPRTIDYAIYQGDDNVGPSPLLASGSTVIRRQGWHVVDLSLHDVTITSGDFFLSITTGQNEFIGADSTVSGHSWYYSKQWIEDNAAEYAIQAVVQEPNHETQFDRVNNLVGIDIPDPVTGTYTITVGGYNVPYGPQSYALVVSGVGRPLGTETVTRTIPSTGTYRFGNTGVTIEFIEENLDAVAVTVHRDQFPNQSTNDVIKRTYHIVPIPADGTFVTNVTFGYEQAEFEATRGTFTENEIALWRWDGQNWIHSIASQQDTVENTVTLNAVDSFSTWCLGGGGSGPTVLGVQRMGVERAAIAKPDFFWLAMMACLAVVLVIVLRPSSRRFP